MKKVLCGSNIRVGMCIFNVKQKKCFQQLMKSGQIFKLKTMLDLCMIRTSSVPAHMVLFSFIYVHCSGH